MSPRDLGGTIFSHPWRRTSNHCRTFRRQRATLPRARYADSVAYRLEGLPARASVALPCLPLYLPYL